MCKITFDTKLISYDQILDIFWKSHDPTTLNRQGNDYGTQYRSAIYYKNDSQKESVQKSISKAKKVFDDLTKKKSESALLLVFEGDFSRFLIINLK